MLQINRDRLHRMVRTSAAALTLLHGMAHMVHATTPNPPTNSTATDRTHPQTPTTFQLALFEAARHADLDAFMRLLPLCGDLGEVTDRGEPIVSAIIRPDPQLTLQDPTSNWSNPKEQARLFRLHRATLDTRLRMLRAALNQGANPNDVTLQHRLPALQLAIAFGSPDMVDTVIQHGGDPRSASPEGLTPLEFLLAPLSAMHPRRLPEMLTRDERTKIVAMLRAAGSPDPRFVNWNDVISLVSGDQWLKHLLSTLHPTESDLMNPFGTALPTAAAAFLGDEAALRTLLAHVPRYKTARVKPEKNPPFDRKLDAAIAAILGGHSKLARNLLEANMPWQQRGPWGGSTFSRYTKLDETSSHTALDAAIYQGDFDLTRQLLDWEAPIQFGLTTAVQRRNQAMVQLLMQRGADPVKNPADYGDQTPLAVAIQQAPELLPTLLDNPKPATRRALNERGSEWLRLALNASTIKTATRRLLVETLLKAGINGPTLPPTVLQWAIMTGDRDIVDRLHEAQAPWPSSSVADAMRTGQLDLIEQVSRLSGQSLSSSCPQDYEALIRLVREAPPFADRLLDQGLQIGDCDQSGPLSHRLLRAWGSPQSRPLMGTRYQRAKALLDRLWQTDPTQRDLPASLLATAITEHRPDLLNLALGAAPTSQDHLGRLAQAAIDAQNPEALRVLRNHGLSGETPLPGGRTLTWHLGCDKPVTWRPLAGLNEQPAPTCPQKLIHRPSPAEAALAQRLPGRYYLSGVHEVGSELKLSADGRYTSATSYGGVDLFTEGRWRVEGQEVVLHDNDALPTPPFRVLKAWHAPGAKSVNVRATSGGRLMQGFVVMAVSREISIVGQLSPRDDEGWTNFDGDANYVNQIEGLAIGFAYGDGLRWGLLPLSADEQGRMPNRIEIDVNRAALTPPSGEARLRLDKDALVSADDAEDSGRRYQRADRD